MSSLVTPALRAELVARSEPAAAVPLALDTVEDLAGLEALRDEWNELLRAGAPHRLFLTWEWLHTWCRHLLEDRRLHIVTVRGGGRLLAIAPLARRPARLRRLLPFSALEFLGSGSVGSDYLDLLVRPGCEDAALGALARHFTQGERVLELSRVEAGVAQANRLAADLRQQGWDARTTPTDTCPTIDLSRHTWESYLATLAQAHRYNWRRRLKGLEKRWRVRLELARSEAQRADALQALVALHQRRWHERGCPGAFHTPALLAFHDELSRLALARGWLRLYVLRLDDRPAAALYGFSYEGTFYFYQSGFDPELGKQSVGLVLMGLAIRSAIDEGIRVYDFLRGDESYKFLWAREARRLVRLDLFPPCARGRACRAAVDLRGRIRGLFGPAPAAQTAGPP